MRIRFESGYGLPFCQILSILIMIIVARSFFQKDNKYYPQVGLRECGYELVNEL